MKLFKLFLFALALSFVAPQAMDAKPRKKHRTTTKKKRAHRHDWRYTYCPNAPDGPCEYECLKCGQRKWM